MKSIELSYVERFDGWGYRGDGHKWDACVKYAGFTPQSDNAEHLQAAVVAIAFSEGLVIREDQVGTDHAPKALNAWYRSSGDQECKYCHRTFDLDTRRPSLAGPDGERKPSPYCCSNCETEAHDANE